MIINRPTNQATSPIRFRLRQLFIAMTIVAGMLGALAWYGHAAGKAQRAAREYATHQASQLPPK